MRLIDGRERLALVVLSVVILGLLRGLLRAELTRRLSRQLMFEVSLRDPRRRRTSILLIALDSGFLHLVGCLVSGNFLEAMGALRGELMLRGLLILALER